MKLNIRQTVASIFLVLAVIPGLSRSAENGAEAAIAQTLSRYESALNASDTATIVDLYTQDGIQMAPDAPAAVGSSAVRFAYENTFKAIELRLHFIVDELKLLSDTTALLRTHSIGTLKFNGQEQEAGPAAFKELFFLQKQTDGQWKFSHYSFSGSPVKP